MEFKFPEKEYKDRQERFRKELVERGITCSVVTAPENIYYLTGHHTPGYYTYQALVFRTAGTHELVMRESEVINAEGSAVVDRIEGYRDGDNPIAVTAEMVGSTEAIGVEGRSWFLTPVQHRELLQRVEANATAEIDDCISGLRLVKSDREIAAIREASDIVNRSIRTAMDAVRDGIRERDIAGILFEDMIRSGSDYLGMEPFVASGERSGRIHASWSDRVIRTGDPVLIELAAARERYHSVLMHTTNTGGYSAKFQKLADVCREARDKTVEAMKPGVTGEECHEVCVGVIQDNGLGEYYRKRTGYSVGIAFAPDWGEGNIYSLGYGENRPLCPGMVVHVVPAIRIPYEGGVGFSATVVVTNDGAEILTGVEND